MTTTRGGAAAAPRGRRKRGDEGAAGEGDDDDDDDDVSLSATSHSGKSSPDSGSKAKAGLRGSFGGLELTTGSEVRKMSVAFLYRLASQIATGKTAADRAALAKGKPILSLPDFVVHMMTEQYGMRDLAQTYLCEMYKGLADHRLDSTRLQMFSSAVGLFASPKPMKPAQHTMVLDLVDAIADALDSERALSQCRRDQLYSRWGR